MPLNEAHDPGDTITSADMNALAALVNDLDTDALRTAAAPELIRDTIGTALVAGTNVTITPNDGSDTITIAASGGGGSVPSTFAKRTAGSLTVSSSSWANITNAPDLTLSGVTAGDTIEVALNALVQTGGTDAHLSLDVATINAGSIVTHIGSGVASPSSGVYGLQGWHCRGAAPNFWLLGAPVLYTVTSGDLASGVLTLRLRGMSPSASATIFAASDRPFYFLAKNLKQ